MVLAQWKDRTLFILVGVALCVEIAILLHQMRVVDLPWEFGRESSGGTVVGEILSRENEVRNRSEGSLTWYRTDSGDVVHLDDTLLTGASSRVRVQLSPEGELDIGPNSMIRFSKNLIDTQGPLLSLEVKRGVAKVRSQSAPLNLSVRKQKLSLEEKSEVIITAKALASKTQIEVSEGGLSSAETKASFKAGQAIEVGNQREINAISLPLAFSPSAPKSDELLTQSDAVNFLWAGDPAKFVELSESVDFAKSRSIPVKGNSLKTKLNPGKYYWRLKQGNRVSAATQFVLRPPVNIGLIFPKENLTIRQKKSLTLRWRRVDIASGFLVQLSRDKSFKKLIEKRVGTNKVVFTNLKPGAYFWRVRAEHPQFGEWPFSETRRFKIKKRLAPPKTKGVKVLKKRSQLKKQSPLSFFARALDRIDQLIFPRAYASEPSVRLNFEWKAVEGAKAYQFELSRSKAFEELAIVEKVEDTFIGVDVEVNQVYFWRVRGIEEGGELGQPSPPLRVEPKRLLQIFARGEAAKSQGVKVVRTPTFYSFALGPRAGVYSQSIRDSAGETTSSGLPLNRGDFKFRFGNPLRPWEVRAWFQNLKYSSENSELSGVQGDLKHTLFGGQLLWQSPWRWPLRFGFHLEHLPVLRRQTSTVSVSGELYYALIVGQSFFMRLGPHFRVTSDILLEGTPLGNVRGIGAIFRSRLFHRKLTARVWGMFMGPELELGFYPSLRWAQPNNQRMLTFDFSASLLLAFQFVS